MVVHFGVHTERQIGIKMVADIRDDKPDGVALLFYQPDSKLIWVVIHFLSRFQNQLTGGAGYAARLFI